MGENICTNTVQKKVLIIYGSERVKQSGLFEDVTKSLREHGIEYIECGGVKSNPTISKSP